MTDNPDHQRALELFEQGKPLEAITFLETAIRSAESSALWNDWATAQHRCGNPGRAEEGYRRALLLDDSDRDAAVNLGLLLLSQGRVLDGSRLIDRHKDKLNRDEQEAVRALLDHFQRQSVPVPRLQAPEVRNPFVAFGCAGAGVPPLSLGTFLSESYAQNQEDLILEALFRALFTKNGRQMNSITYLELGACHPIQTSNTFLFSRKYGCKGVLVEANPALVENLRKVRPSDLVIHCAIVSNDASEVEFTVADTVELSSLSPEHIRSFGTMAKKLSRVRVPAMTVNRLIQHYHLGSPDILSVDLEGLDLEVLSQLDYSTYRPAVVICEPSSHFCAETGAKMTNLLGAVGYSLAARTDVNLIFADRSLLNA